MQQRRWQSTGTDTIWTSKFIIIRHVNYRRNKHSGHWGSGFRFWGGHSDWPTFRPQAAVVADTGQPGARGGGEGDASEPRADSGRGGGGGGGGGGGSGDGSGGGGDPERSWWRRGQGGGVGRADGGPVAGSARSPAARHAVEAAAGVRRDGLQPTAAVVGAGGGEGRGGRGAGRRGLGRQRRTHPQGTSWARGERGAKGGLGRGATHP